MSGKNKKNAAQLNQQLPVAGLAANQPVLPCQQNKDPQLKVKVWGKIGGKKRAVQATVTANAKSQASVAQTGIADFSYVEPDTYNVQATAILAPDDVDFYALPDQEQVTLGKGDKKTLNIEVKPRNVVTPKIELEYKVVVFDRDLAQYQTAAGEAADKLLRPAPTRIEVSIECSEGAPPYTGDGTLDAPNCEVFLDPECQQPLGARKLTNAELTADSATKLYLRGTTRGLFTLTLTLDPSADTRHKIEDPATEDMGVVEMQLEVFQHATPVNVAATTYSLPGKCPDLEAADLIPDQVVMSDDDKVSKGRLLHQQKQDRHGRAKAVLKLTAAEWPPGTDDYKIVFESTPGDLKAFDAETEGSSKKLPAKIPVSELKTGDQTWWIAGAKASAELRGVRLSLALDRSSGGLSKEAKSHADWARFTVVKIESVKLEYTAPAAGQPKPWNASKKRWYINYQAGDAGRTVKIRAKLSKPIAGIKLHFMLSPDKNNLLEYNWGIDLPATWNWDGVDANVKQKDKDNATDLLHVSEDTDAQGQADKDLVLSQIGGDRFWPAAYIAQDPHLAAYVHGHATLEERKPKLASDPIKVWRRFAYQLVKVAGRNYPSASTSEGVYGRVKADMHARPPLRNSRATVQAMALPSLLPEYMFKLNGSNRLALNVSDANQTQFFAAIAAEGEHPLKVPILTGDFNWGNERNSAAVAAFDSLASAFPRNVLTDVHACDPPLQGGALLVSGDWTAAERNAAANGGAGAWVNVRNGVLAAGDVDIDRRRTSINAVRVDAPAGIGPTDATTHIWVTNLVVQGAPDHFLGGYNIDGNQRIVCVFDPTERRDYQNTIIHELGHAFHQTGGVAPAAGIPANPNFIMNTTGPHCTHGTDICVMFTSGPIPGSLNRYCPDCHPHLLVQDMTTLS